MTVKKKKIVEPDFQALGMKRNSRKEFSIASPYNSRAQSEEHVNCANIKMPKATQLSNSFQLGRDSCLEAYSNWHSI